MPTRALLLAKAGWQRKPSPQAFSASSCSLATPLPSFAALRLQQVTPILLPASLAPLRALTLAWRPGLKNGPTVSNIANDWPALEQRGMPRNVDVGATP